jgi:di/tricarboxylate transporter
LPAHQDNHYDSGSAPSSEQGRRHVAPGSQRDNPDVPASPGHTGQPENTAPRQETPPPKPAPLGGRPADSIRAALLIAACISVVWIAGQWLQAPPALIWAGALVSTVCCWAVGALPEPTATLLFFLAAVVFHIAPPTVVFSGFTSTAWWLMFGGAVTGVALRSTGLALRLADIIFHKRVGTYPQVITTVALSAVGLAFLMPSTTGRVLLLMPIVLALADRLGFAPGSNGRIGMVLTVAAASYMPPTSILPANIPNSVLLGAASSLYGINLSYGSYLLLHFPVLGVLKTVVLIWVICRCSRKAGRSPQAASAARDGAAGARAGDHPGAGRGGLRHRCLARHFARVDLAGGVHRLPAAGHRAGIAQGLTEQVHLVPLIYVAGFLGLGAVVESTGLGSAISAGLLHWLPMTPGHTAANVGTIGAMGAVMGMLSTLPALPAVLTPLAADLAKATGLPLESVLMLQVPVFSTVFFPYQSPPIVIAMQLGGVGLRHGTRLCLTMAAITIVALLPLDYLWWRLLGYLP